MKRIRIGELVKETGLSRATVDRAINDRGGVHARTRAVIDEAVRRLNTVSPRGAEQAVSADLVMRVGRGFYDQLSSVAQEPHFAGLTLHDMYQTGDEEMLELVSRLCRNLERPLILTAKNSEPLRAELVQARRRGKQVITFVSDLSHDCRDGFVGIDNRMAGQTAAFIIGSLLRHREAKAGVVLGNYAYSCHEDREIGFRSSLRAHHPNVQIADVAKGEDSTEQTYLAVRDLLRTHSDIDAIYNVAGGNAGLAKALTESGRSPSIHVITHEVNHITVPLIRAGTVHYAIAQIPLDLLVKAVDLAVGQTPFGRKELHLVDFAVYTRFNIPQFAMPDEMRPENPLLQG
jgi:LacI family transcriptional regulator